MFKIGGGGENAGGSKEGGGKREGGGSKEGGGKRDVGGRREGGGRTLSKYFKSGLQVLKVHEESFLQNDESSFLQSSSLVLSPSFQAFLSFSLPTSSTLRQSTVFSSSFLAQFPLAEEVFGENEWKTCSLTTFLNKTELFYIIGTNEGGVYLFPFNFSENYAIFEYKSSLPPNTVSLYNVPSSFPPPSTFSSSYPALSSSSFMAIRNLYLFKNCLFVQQGKDRLICLQIFFEENNRESGFSIHNLKKCEKLILKAEAEIVAFHKIKILKPGDEPPDEV